MLQLFPRKIYWCWKSSQIEFIIDGGVIEELRAVRIPVWMRID
jgi:hypothetical protein